MPDYKSMYLQLFNRISDAIDLLQGAQEETEESYLLDFPAEQSDGNTPD